MELFSTHIARVRKFMEERLDVRTFRAFPSRPWPEGGGRDVVLMSDVGVELGGPETESYSLILWTENSSLVNKDTISLIGPELAEAGSRSIAFGRIVILSIEGFTEENTFRRCREMEQMRFLLDLKGFMIRAVPQFQREWSRVSRDAISRGFSLGVLGSSLMRLFRELDYVTGSEIIFITENEDAIRKIRSLTGDTARIIAAMNKMAEEMSFDCSECEYRDVCDEAEDLRRMRDACVGNAAWR